MSERIEDEIDQFRCDTEPMDPPAFARQGYGLLLRAQSELRQLRSQLRTVIEAAREGMSTRGPHAECRTCQRFRDQGYARDCFTCQALSRIEAVAKEVGV